MNYLFRQPLNYDQGMSLKYERPELFKQIGIKVAQMHILGVYHGDLNINNIMVSEDLSDITVI